jgi:glycine/D-amino acid oxidase-like deaminating enzyme
MEHASVAVLGAGLLGASVALELAAKGVKVDLYEKRASCVAGASAQNEGKIHLGFLFARDSSLRSAKAMILGALSFGPLLRRWLGDALDGIAVSSPFQYVVHASSMVEPDTFQRYLAEVHRLQLEALAAAAGDYFGQDLRAPPRRLTQDGAPLYDPASVQAVFQTSEIAIDPELLAKAMRRRLASDPNIRILAGAQVTAVARVDAELSVSFMDADGSSAARYSHIVNALWENRLAIDETLGLMPQRPWSFRAKRYLRVCGIADAGDIPSTTIVLGRFGDVVNYQNGALHLSWYPAGLEAFSREVLPPPFLDPSPARASELRRETVAALSRLMPRIGDLDARAIAQAEVKGGIVFAWGDTDIDDFASGLHERYAIGPLASGSYHSVDTGKLTTAPFFAKAVADRICPTL